VPSITFVSPPKLITAWLLVKYPNTGFHQLVIGGNSPRGEWDKGSLASLTGFPASLCQITGLGFHLDWSGGDNAILAVERALAAARSINNESFHNATHDAATGSSCLAGTRWLGNGAPGDALGQSELYQVWGTLPPEVFRAASTILTPTVVRLMATS